MMNTLFIDIDNTLIYSHNRQLFEEKKVAEFLDGKEQSYITSRTLDFLRDKEINIVPITTRFRFQYDRLNELMAELRVTDAVICNGGILLNNGRVDESWRRESKSIVGTQIVDLKQVEKILREEVNQTSIHVEDGLMLYSKTENPEEIAEKIIKELGLENIDVDYDLKKVYCTAKNNNKGIALSRYIKRNKIEFSIAAGDSKFDIPMLNEADLAIVPEELSHRINNPNKIVIGKAVCFSDGICDAIRRL